MQIKSKIFGDHKFGLNLKENVLILSRRVLNVSQKTYPVEYIIFYVYSFWESFYFKPSEFGIIYCMSFLFWPNLWIRETITNKKYGLYKCKEFVFELSQKIFQYMYTKVSNRWKYHFTFESFSQKMTSSYIYGFDMLKKSYNILSYFFRCYKKFLFHV